MSNYENFRTVLTMNLAQVLPADQLKAALDAVDLTMSDYEITRKKMEIVPSGGVPDILKLYLSSKGISNLSPSTLKQYHFKLTKFFDVVRKSYIDVDPNDIRLYLARLRFERRCSDSYVNSHRVAINTFFQWLVDNDYLQKNPAAKVEKIKCEEKQLPPLTPLELEQIRFCAADIREKALIDFLYSTGCRAAECISVRMSDIDWRTRAVLIRHGKGNKARTVYFNSESELSLKEYLKTRSDNNDALFVGIKAPHNAIGVRGLENILRKIRVRSGINVHPHKLRRTFATAGLHGGMPLEKVQKLMGHTSPKTTLRYALLDQSTIRMEHERVYA